MADAPLAPRTQSPAQEREGAVAGSPRLSAVADLPVSFYWAVLRRYAGRIAALVALATLITVVVASRLPKLYSATAVLRVDPSGNHTVGDETPANSNSASAERLLTTEANVVTSPAVVLKTIQALQLDRKPGFEPSPLPPVGTALTVTATNQVLEKVTASISVGQPLDTDLLAVTFRSRDPHLSASVANSLLDSLIQQDYDTRVKALTGASASMRAQLVDLQAKMEQSQQALVEYESSHDVLNPDSSDNIMQARLSQVNTDLVKAQTRRIALQADDVVSQSGSLDALLASDRGKALQPLWQQLQADERNLARMAQVYGPNLPAYRQQQALVMHDREVLLAGQQHISEQIRAEFIVARAREALLRDELNVQKHRMDAFNRKAIRYSALKAAADAYTKLYYQLQQSIQDATVAANLRSESLRVISPALPNPKPVSPRLLLLTLLVVVSSGMLGIAVALGVGILDRTLAAPEQIEQIFNLPVVAALPQVPSRQAKELAPFGYGVKLVGDAPGDAAPTQDFSFESPYREAILGLHSALMLLQGRDLHVLALTSATPAEGKSTLAANLAAAFGALSGRTVLVDTDMRKPSAYRLLGLSNRRGLSNVLRGQATLDQTLVEVPNCPRLALLPAGPMPSAPGQLLHRGLEELLEELRSRFEYVIFDCAPVLGFSDALFPANMADATLLVVKAGVTERQFVAGALRQLEGARARVEGLVLNSTSSKLGSYYGYYQHYYGYQSVEGSRDEDPTDD